MPKISYQEIVTADVSESGTVLHEWVMNEKGQLYHLVNGVFYFKFAGDLAIKKWNELCRSK